MRPVDYYSKIDDRSAAWSDLRLDKNFAPFSKVLLPLFDNMPDGGDVLDIGCQGGHLLRLIKQKFSKAYGLDIVEYKDDWAIDKDIIFSVHDVDASPLPYSDEQFKCVICTNVFEHIFDVFNLASEISRITKPNGYCIIMVPNVAYIKHLINLIRGRVPRTGAQSYPFSEKDGWDGCHLHYFTINEMKNILQTNGIETLIVNSSGRWSLIRKIWKNLLYADIVLLGKKIAF